MATTLGPLKIDRVRGRASVGGRALALRPLDLRVLSLLARRPGRVWSRASLAEALWGPDGTVDPRAIDVCVTRLRRALDGAGDAIVTVRRVGYRLDPDLLGEITR
ncbi:MAG: winged helix-turn-helix domain-containing protein [Actinomycetota bacterium]